VRVVEVVATCILQSWDGAAMVERGGRSVVAVLATLSHCNLST
jgi:hypothetical protein